MADSGLRFAVQMLNGENYPVWSYKLELMLIKDNLWTVIKDSPPSPVTAEWSRKDDQARALIGLTVDDNQLMHIRNAGSAKAAWSALKEYHQKATLTSKVHLLKRVCRLVLKDGGNMEEHITTFSNYVTQLSALGQDLPDNLLAALLLGSLPESYDTLVTALESRPEKDLTSQLVKSKLIDEYKRRKGAEESNRSSYGDDSALKASHINSRSDNKSCFFCKKSGHLKRDCFKYRNWKQKQEMANQVTENFCHKEDEFCFHATTSGSSSEKALLEEKSHKGFSHSWLVDSGASSHMVNSRHFFHSFDPSRKGDVRLADVDKLAAIKGIGKGAINCAVKGKVFKMWIDNVLYVPSLSSNLLSVKKLVKDGFTLKFKDQDCIIAKNGEVKAVAKLSSEFYELKTVEGACAASGAIKYTRGKNWQYTWQRRFEHQDQDAIRGLVRNVPEGVINAGKGTSLRKVKEIPADIIKKPKGNIKNATERCGLHK